MAQVTAQMVKELRDRTGVGMGKCKEALEEANGDIELAIANLRKAGMASAVKKEGRETKEGIIKTFETSELLALIEVNAETDFVVKNEKFQAFAESLAKEVGSKRPASVDDFLQMKSSHDPNLSIDQLRAVTVQSLGENIKIRRTDVFLKKPNSSVALYSHMGGKLVTVVEIEGSNKEHALAKDIAMHIAAESPEYLASNEVPERVIDHEREIAKAQIQNKPAHIIEKIVDGKLQAYFNQVCLLNQPYVRDPSLTIEQLVAQRGKEIGHPLKVAQFIRWKVGE